MSTKRHQARQDAFCLLFEKTFTDEDIDQIIEGATQTRDLQVDRFTLDLAKGTVEHMQEIDALIEPKLKNWKLSRLSRVSLSVLRMAVYELKYLTDIPAGVTINEAVELAKKYSMQEDAAYINGVLGAFAKAHRTGDEQ